VITKEYLHERFEYRDGELYWKKVYSPRLKVGQRAGTDEGNGYRCIVIGKTRHKTHRLIWIMHNGDIPEGLFVDHLNMDRTDNRIENLRLSTKAGNNRNQNATGVSWDKARKKWRSQISINNVTKMLGRFDSFEEAAQAYQDKKKELHSKEYPN
jgi:hypothetical protein